MPEMWVTGPGGERRGIPEIAARLQAEIRAIEALAVEEACRLCGQLARLTREHVPAKKAGNPRRGIRVVIDYVKSVATGQLFRTAQVAQGDAVQTLCQRCNNNTGAWYNPAYIRLARHCAKLAREESAGSVCGVDLEVHPQRVLKQALTSIVATSQRGLTARYPELRRLLTEREALGPIAPIRVWMYLPANRVTRRTGLTVWVDQNHGIGHIRAEFSSWPLGWIATFGDPPIEGAVDVSAWSEVGYHVKAGVTLQVPCQWALSEYPGDFRPPEAFR